MNYQAASAGPARLKTRPVFWGKQFFFAATQRLGNHLLSCHLAASSMMAD
jgi:hypothetical protein